MKLRCSNSSRQRLFALGFAFLSLWGMVGGVCAQDRLFTKDGKVQNTKILGVTGASVQIQVANGGSIGIPLAMIAKVEKEAPAEFTAAQKDYESGAYAKALPAIKGVADKFKGLPLDWAQKATSQVGDICVALGKLPEAEAAYADFKKYYPGSGSDQTEVGMARIAVAREHYSEAKAKLEPIAEKALKEKSATPAMAPVYSQTFLLLGQIAEAEKQFPIALENYLRTVTLFPQDHSAAATAQEKADALRKNNPALAVP